MAEVLEHVLDQHRDHGLVLDEENTAAGGVLKHHHPLWFGHCRPYRSKAQRDPRLRWSGLQLVARPP
jgi:hypothetical protein